MYRNNESVTPNPRSPLEDYSLHIIDLHTGRLCDTRAFKCDKIILSHNQGLYLYRNILAVLSVQQQTIHVFQVSWFTIYILHFFEFKWHHWCQKWLPTITERQNTYKLVVDSHLQSNRQNNCWQWTFLQTTDILKLSISLCCNFTFHCYVVTILCLCSGSQKLLGKVKEKVNLLLKISDAPIRLFLCQHRCLGFVYLSVPKTNAVP